MSKQYHPIGDFMFLKDHHKTMVLSAMFVSVEKMGMWDWLKKNTPNEVEGYMFWSHKNIYTIYENMRYAQKYCRSVRILALALIHMKFIAKNGWSTYMKTYDKS